VPLVVYHGERDWNVPATFLDTVAAAAAVRPGHLDFAYALADLGAIKDGELSRQARLRAALLALKHALRGGDPWPALTAALEALPVDDPLLRPLLTYMLTVYNALDRPMVMRAIAGVGREEDRAMLSIAAEEWLAEGRAAGIALGQAAALLRLLRRRFGELPADVEDRVRGAGTDALDRWTDAVLDAVFDEPDGPAPR
jgi:hypothetical protein